MNRVIHFDIQADDPQRAIDFYTNVFGWKIEKWKEPSNTMDYWLIMTGKGPGIDGGLGKRQEPVKGSKAIIAFMCTIGVKSLEESMNKVKQYGGSIVMEKMTIPKVGYMANCLDTEGNMFGIIQEDKKAKQT